MCCFFAKVEKIEEKVAHEKLIEINPQIMMGKPVIKYTKLLLN